MRLSSSSRSFLRGLVLLSSLSLVSATWSDYFAGFFPEYNSGFQMLLRDNCSSEYAIYREHRGDNVKSDPVLAAFSVDSAAFHVVQCLLQAAPEIVKAKMASAQVVLGLTPTILASLGTSPQETAMLSVIARRPLLAGLLAAGSPAVFTLRSFEYARIIEDLHERNILTPAIFLSLDPIIVILEYLAAAVSIGNIIELCYRLGGRVVTSIFTGSEYYFYLWAFLGLVVHGLGALALYLRTKVTTPGRDDVPHGSHNFRKYRHAALNQFKPIAQQTPLHILILEQSLLFFAVYWVTNILAVTNILYGTVLFSSMLFISVTDGLVVIARLMASVTVCRIVLTYELANLRKVVKIERKRPEGVEIEMDNR